MRAAAILLLLTFIAVAAAAVWALLLRHPTTPPPLSVERGTYAVFGATRDAMNASMAIGGPDRRLGAMYMRLSGPQFRTEPARRGPGCRVVPTLRVEIKVKLPKIWFLSSPPACLRRSFAAMAERLAEHEEGHVDLAKAAARRLEERLGAIFSETGCAAAEAEGRRAVADEMAALDREQRAYDEETQHGILQGVVFADCPAE